MSLTPPPLPFPLAPVIFPNTWTGDRNDTFLVKELAPYLRWLVRHPSSIPEFVLSNPIGSGMLHPNNDTYKAICRLTEFNHLT